jgi:hypothetical protein
MPYVEYDEFGKVIGTYALPQPNKTLVWVEGEVFHEYEKEILRKQAEQ